MWAGAVKLRLFFLPMNDTAFTLYFITKFYPLPLLILAAAVAILFAVVLRSFKFLLWSAIALSVTVNVWIAAFGFFRL